METILLSAAGVLLAIVIIFAGSILLKKFMPKPRAPEKVHGHSGFDSEGTPVVWFRDREDFDRYQSGPSSKKLAKTMENDYQFYR